MAWLNSERMWQVGSKEREREREGGAPPNRRGFVKPGGRVAGTSSAISTKRVRGDCEGTHAHTSAGHVPGRCERMRFLE